MIGIGGAGNYDQTTPLQPVRCFLPASRAFVANSHSAGINFLQSGLAPAGLSTQATALAGSVRLSAQEPSPVILDSGRTAKCSTSLIPGRAS